ncbi:MCE family protein [Nocardioides carbamazepini]|uniref:MlaD family protein n=1 Tax=Nocardioides carbamazepini TaxID=2854259 RepID=UPI0023575772|nr:MlaD family protein [Nocardioides carbamazepini]MCR1785749.1 MCE family protein [Nocardioides carbamazepini]
MTLDPLVRWLRSPLGIGSLVVALFGAAVVFGLNATHGMPLAERKEVRIAFDDLSGLNTGDDVRIAGSRVGYVDALELDDGQAVAVIKLDDPDTPLYEDARAARVSDRSGLGQKFVTLDPGDPSTGPLRDGGVIPADQTVEAEEVNELLDVFDEQTRADASTTLKNLGGGLAAHGEDLHRFLGDAPGILEDTGTVSGALATGGGTPLERMLASGDRLTGRLAARDDELAALVDQLAVTVDAFAVDGGDPVRASLDRAPDTLDSADAALRALDAPLADLAVAMREIRPGAVSLGRATPDLRALLREGVTPVRKMPGVNRSAVPGVQALDALVADARPLADQLVTTGSTAAPLAGVLGDYADDISRYYTGASASLSHGDRAGHWLRILLLPAPENAGLPLLVDRDPYPEPGETW